jgi:hypothetical protein
MDVSAATLMSMIYTHFTCFHDTCLDDRATGEVYARNFILFGKWYQYGTINIFTTPGNFFYKVSL